MLKLMHTIQAHLPMKKLIGKEYFQMRQYTKQIR